jgi:hypothetical protein
MNSSGSAVREEVSSVEAPASPSIRYPLSAVRYPLAAIGKRRTEGGERRAEGGLQMALARRMKRNARLMVLLWIPFWYVIGQLALFAWMDESWELERTISERQKWKILHQRVAEYRDRPFVLMLGSSRTDQAFQASRLSGQLAPDGRPILAFNLGVPTVGGMHEMMYLNDLLDEGIRPRLVLVECVSTHLIRSQRGLQSEEHFTVPAWISGHQLLFLQRYFTNRRRAFTEWLESRLTPWYGFRWAVHEHLRGEHYILRPFDQSRRPIDPWGWRLLRDLPDTPDARMWRWACAYRMYGETLHNFHIGPKPAKALSDVIARCRKEKIPVALVLMPVTQQFRDLYCPEGRAELENYIAQLRLRFNLDIIDATDWLDEEDFDDGHHAMISGAEKFTTRLIPIVHDLLSRTEPAKETSSE